MGGGGAAVGGTYRVLSEELLKGMPYPERIAAIESALLAAAEGHNDDVALELVELLSATYHKEEWEISIREKKTTADYHRGEQRFCDHIRRLYWQLPDSRKPLGRYTTNATLLKTKLRILGEIIKEWGSPHERSISAFRFLIAAYRPLPEDKPRCDGESDEEMLARGRWVFHEEQEAILQLIRQRTDSSWQPKDLEFWLQQLYVPEEIQRILIIARARNGGMALVERDLWFARLLKPLDPEGRTPGAFALYENFCAKLKALEEKVVELVDAMKLKSDRLWHKEWSSRDQIGGSKYVEGEINVGYPNLDLTTAAITVQLEPDCSEVLGCNIFNRALRHIEEWREKHPDISVELTVSGGKGGLNLNHR